MAKPRRGFLFALDARVLGAGAEFHRAGHAEFYGLQVARALELEPSSAYKALHRLTRLGLLDQRWEGRRCLYALNQHGRDALTHARAGRRALGRQSPTDSNSARPRPRPRPKPGPLRAQRGPRRSSRRRR